jgi:hypothetical protein
MPWCTNCRYEYRPGFTHCSTCGADLVDEEPPHAPTVAGIRVEANTAHLVEEIVDAPGHALIPAFAVAREAVRILLKARSMLLIVGILSTFYFLGSLLPIWNHLREHPDYNLYRQPQSAPLLQIWIEDTQRQRPLNFLLQNFTEPLKTPNQAVTPYLDMLYTAVFQGRASALQNPRMISLLRVAQFLWMLLVAGLAYAVFQVLLISWLVAHATGKPLIPCRRALRLYLKPLLTIILITGIAISIPLYFLSQQSASTIIPILNEIIVYWIKPVVWLLLTLAPFVIVVRGLDAWTGVKAGVLTLWEQRWVLAGIFLIDRILYELLYILRILVLPSDYFYAIAAQPRIVVLYWFESLIFAFLGLWLAMTFALLVSKQKIAQPAIPPSTVS